MWVTAAATTALLAPLALRFALHDELYVLGHMSIAAELQNGIYPPRHLSFPDLPLRYHYGFDLLSASLTALLHVPVDRAIHLAALGLWFLSWCLLWVLGERLVGRARAFFVPLLALLGGGLPFFCGPAGRPLVSVVVDSCRVGGHGVNPPVSSYFFQHPWSLGLPLALTAILLHTERRAPVERARLGALGLVLAMLSMGQIVAFAALVPSLVVAEAYVDGGLDLRRALRAVAVAAVALVTARLLGGFFTHAPGLPPLPLEFHAGFEDTWPATLAWNLSSLGLLLPLGLAGLFLVRRARLLFALLIGGSLVVLNAVRYGFSADIMKFCTLASFLLGALGGVAIARLLGPRPGPPRLLLAGALLVPATAAGVLFPLTYALDLHEIPAAYRQLPDALAGPDVAAVVWLRDHAKAGEMVYRNGSATHGYAQWGGLPQSEVTWATRAFSLPEARMAAREQLLKAMPEDPDAWQRDGFRWFVLDGSPADKPLSEHAAAWIARGRARVAATFGPLRVVELSPP